MHRPQNGDNTPLIELRDVTKTFKSDGLTVEVLHGISLQIFEGEFVALMGTSGSGKTTLMNILGCLDRPTTGTYLFAGRDVSRFDRDQLALLRRDTFGFIFQSYHLLPTATAAENVEVPAIYAGVGYRRRMERARQLLSDLGLGNRLDHRPSQLSGGQQQRVSIARALINGGRVILADEPTGALDSRSGEEVMALLKQLHRNGHTIILITHDADVAAKADRLIQIRDGSITSDSGPSAIPPADRKPGDPPVLDGSRMYDDPVSGRMEGIVPDMIEAAKMALRSLRGNLFRTFLTLLGIIIGVGSVVTMLALGNGSKQEVLSRIEAMGTNLLLVRPGMPNIRGTGDIATLTPEDAEALTEVPNVLHATPEYTGMVTVRFGNKDYSTSANTTTAEYPSARDWPVAQGAFFARRDVQSYAPVVVLGKTVVDAVFPPGSNPVGQYVLVNNVPFQVIGVMSVKGATPYGNHDMDDVVFVPLTTGRMRLFGKNYVKSIAVQVADVKEIDATQQAVHDLLLARHKVEDFQIRNMASILDTVSETQNTMTLLLGSIAAISLLVGGIGVMNIMLVSVTERTREIGIRMATGARMFNILLQFNTEALVVCSIGGVLGVAGGIGAAWLARILGSPVVFSLSPVVLAFGSAFATGLLFGYLPAKKAAGLDPVVALSSE